jgi:hypothetical protein
MVGDDHVSCGLRWQRFVLFPKVASANAHLLFNRTPGARPSETRSGRAKKRALTNVNAGLREIVQIDR